MKKLSLRELKEMCDLHPLNEFIFASENQLRNKADNTINVNLNFSTILITLNPNIICFKNVNGVLCLNRVKDIKISESVLGFILTIICGDLNNHSNDIPYTIIAR